MAFVRSAPPPVPASVLEVLNIKVGGTQSRTAQGEYQSELVLLSLPCPHEQVDGMVGWSSDFGNPTGDMTNRKGNVLEISACL